MLWAVLASLWSNLRPNRLNPSSLHCSIFFFWNKEKNIWNIWNNVLLLCMCRRETTCWSCRVPGSPPWCSRSRWSSPNQNLRWSRSPSRPWRWCRLPQPRYPRSRSDRRPRRACRSPPQSRHQHRYPFPPHVLWPCCELHHEVGFSNPLPSCFVKMC